MSMAAMSEASEGRDMRDGHKQSKSERNNSTSLIVLLEYQRTVD